MNHSPLAIETRELGHAYGRRIALERLSLSIAEGEIFAVLGPNGGGKTTLFRILSTLMPVTRGSARVLGFDLAKQAFDVRLRLGVVFQAPSLDKKLTVLENVLQQAALYGLAGKAARRRADAMLAQMGLSDRLHELTEKLSGGLRRRVELAKGMIHRPALLLLDEPSTGLDPAARADLWQTLRALREEHGVTIVLTTHLLEEAERVDRLAILDRGRLVALDTPDALRASVGGDAITMDTETPAELAAGIAEKFHCETQIVDGRVRLEQPAGHTWIAKLVEAFPGQIAAITVGKPTLEDVFIAKTGHRFWQAASSNEEARHAQ